MKKIILAIVFLVLGTGISMADTVSIKRFVVKENPFAQNEVAVVATDTLEQIQESVNGKFAFTINGFEYDLTFQNGTAFYRQKLQKSTFMYVKHKNEAGSYSVLYYIYKHGDKLSPWKISWMWLVAIPLIIVFIGYLFKRFIIIAAVVLIIFIYFNHSNGLSIPTFFESIFDGLKHSVMG
ncbi:hypothetical protein [Mucilaginibacter terrae]|uniref:Uncharacterized protein YxeA n=1 Tax=Mucilaginibacter terrae TaxID=1955052 RepID=A0ABU3GRQ7_9SPHI|nr:hypothetical protein [Mucilaginibacter terrae]MDT3402447.1 uncharacterized protein YxeA [Mucilaginibacter terrae]